IARGLARMERDPAAARADFEQALRANPRSTAAAQNLAHVLSERLHLPEESRRVLDQAIAMHPEAAALHCGRAVLNARAGRDEAARTDARTALQLDPSPANQYQAACAFALIFPREPEDLHIAINLLRGALRQ